MQFADVACALKTQTAIFSICSKTSQRNSIFIRYNKGAVREERTILPQDANAGNENRTPRQKTDAAAPFEKNTVPRGCEAIANAAGRLPTIS